MVVGGGGFRHDVWVRPQGPWSPDGERRFPGRGAARCKGVKAAYVGSGESLRESGTVLPEAGVSTRLGCPRQEAMCCPRQEAMMVFSQSARGKGENDNSLVMERLPPVPRRIQSGFIEKNKARFRSKREFSTGAGLHRGWNCWGGVSTTGHSEAPRDWLQLLPPIHPHPVVGSTGDGMTRT